MNAMIFAAGYGSRLLPLTKNKPKALIELKGKPLIAHSIDKLKELGVDKIVINVHHFADQIIQYIENNRFKIPIYISHEKDELLDTGGGLKFAVDFLKSSPTILYNVDIFSDLDLQDLINFHNTNQALATLVVRERETQRYLLFNNQMELIGWKNKKTNESILNSSCDRPLSLAFSGIHIINPEIFKYMPQKKKFSIIELYLTLSQQHKILAFKDNHSNWWDVGTIEKLNLLNNL